MIKLKEITVKSWLLVADEQRIGLLSQKNSGEYVLLAKEAKLEFRNKEEINNFFEMDVFGKIAIDKIEEPAKTFYIRGYPVDYPDPVEVDENDSISPLPLFTKKKGGTVYLCAGYYCLNTDRGWRPVFCPKLSTVEKYNYEGPIKTEFELKRRLSALKKGSR